MAQTITWRDVAAPDTGSAFRDSLLARKAVSDSIRNLGTLGQTFGQSLKDRATDQGISALNQATDVDQIRSVLASLAPDADAALLTGMGRALQKDLIQEERAKTLFDRNTTLFDQLQEDREVGIKAERLFPMVASDALTDARSQGNFDLSNVAEWAAADPRVRARAYGLGFGVYSPEFGKVRDINERRAADDRNHAQAVARTKLSHKLAMERAAASRAGGPSGGPVQDPKMQAAIDAYRRLDSIGGVTTDSVLEARKNPTAFLKSAGGQDAVDDFEKRWRANDPLVRAYPDKGTAAAAYATALDMDSGFFDVTGFNNINDDNTDLSLRALYGVFTGVNAPGKPYDYETPTTTWAQLKDLTKK